MPISVTLLLVIAGVVLLAFGVGSTGGALRFLGGGAALLVAIAATAATILLFFLGQRAGWTSDGPGALFVMIAVVVCAIVAAIGWAAVFGIAGARVDRVPDAPSDSKRVLRRFGIALLAIAAVGQGVTMFLGRGRTAHAAPVVAVSFAISPPRLLSVDAAGTLVEWDLRSKRETRRATIPELAGVTELFVDQTADSGFAIAGGKALRFPIGGTAVQTIPEARHIARGPSVVVARERALLYADYYDWVKRPPREFAWPEPILAIAAKDMYVAVADQRSITLLDGRSTSANVIASAPAPGAVTRLEVLNDGSVVALDGSGGGWLIDVRRGVNAPQPVKASLVAEARHLLLVSGRELSELDLRKKKTIALATIGAGARAIDVSTAHLALGFEGGEVVLGTRVGERLETLRLTAKPNRP